MTKCSDYLNEQDKGRGESKIHEVSDTDDSIDDEGKVFVERYVFSVGCDASFFTLLISFLF